MAKRRKRRRPSSSSSSSPTKRIKTPRKEPDAILCFQDVWKEHCPNSHLDCESMDAEVVSNVFFELANAPSVSYRLEPLPPLDGRSDNDETKIENESKATQSENDDDDAKRITKSPANNNNNNNNNNTIVIQQDVSGAAQTHTGGIVWETSYLLLNYLLSSKEWWNSDHVDVVKTPRTILEIGAGCGLLGFSLHKAFEMGMIGNSDSSLPPSSRVIVTETNEVMDNLRNNFGRNYPLLDLSKDPTTTKVPKANHTVSVEELDWTRCRDDCAKAKIQKGSVDCIVGTDVVFSTRFVRPMLETMRYLSHSCTVVYLCLQERCKDSHELLLREAKDYGFDIQDISESVYNDQELAPYCQFGRLLECKLLKFTVLSVSKDVDRTEKKKSKTEKKTKKKKKKETKN